MGEDNNSWESTAGSYDQRGTKPEVQPRARHLRRRASAYPAQRPWTGQAQIRGNFAIRMTDRTRAESTWECNCPGGGFHDGAPRWRPVRDCEARRDDEPDYRINELRQAGIHPGPPARGDPPGRGRRPGENPVSTGRPAEMSIGLDPAQPGRLAARTLTQLGPDHQGTAKAADGKPQHPGYEEPAAARLAGISWLRLPPETPLTASAGRVRTSGPYAT